ncbi:9824_t:CDS:2 [Diversispora eburnea]|uniref:9824_t:CDS:1 n=1 Tax=Diversispora eburnea TaxID=1213867 RepID=A0A9N9FSY7_9GLOM|nr:9824_t:CDS:2 [Diversispora eburnea]
MNFEYPQYCSLFLVALLNKQESMSTSVGQRQHLLPAMIYLRDPSSHLIWMDQDIGFTPPYLKKSVQFFPRAKFPNDLIIGAEFRVAQWQLHRTSMPFPCPPTSDDLVAAWEEQLNKRDIVDVQFNIDGRQLYASSSLLSRRSTYFSRLFQQQWAENFDYETFLTMLRFLYTGRASSVNPNVTIRDNVLEVFAIADKYLITELRQRAMAKIDRDLTPETAGDVLFGWAWKWSDLKEMVTKYVIKNFGKIRKTQEWKSIGKRYPNSTELMEETLICYMHSIV